MVQRPRSWSCTCPSWSSSAWKGLLPSTSIWIALHSGFRSRPTQTHQKVWSCRLPPAIFLHKSYPAGLKVNPLCQSRRWQIHSPRSFLTFWARKQHHRMIWANWPGSLWSVWQLWLNICPPVPGIYWWAISGAASAFSQKLCRRWSSWAMARCVATLGSWVRCWSSWIQSPWNCWEKPLPKFLARMVHWTSCPKLLCPYFLTAASEALLLPSLRWSQHWVLPCADSLSYWTMAAMAAVCLQLRFPCCGTAFQQSPAATQRAFCAWEPLRPSQAWRPATKKQPNSMAPPKRRTTLQALQLRNWQPCNLNSWQFCKLKRRPSNKLCGAFVHFVTLVWSTLPRPFLGSSRWQLQAGCTECTVIQICVETSQIYDLYPHTYGQIYLSSCPCGLWTQEESNLYTLYTSKVRCERVA